MATFTSNKAVAAAARRYLETGVVVEYSQYTGSATLSAGDVIQMVKVPIGARVLDYVLSTNDLGASGTATLSLGDGLDPDRYFGSGQVADGAGYRVVRGLRKHAGHGYEYTANDTVDVSVVSLGGNAQTSAPVFKLSLAYYCDNG